MATKRKQVWVDIEFYDIMKKSQIPSSRYTKMLAKKLKEQEDKEISIKWGGLRI